jgi:hypothetical protein
VGEGLQCCTRVPTVFILTSEGESFAILFGNSLLPTRFTRSNYRHPGPVNETNRTVSRGLAIADQTRTEYSESISRTSKVQRTGQALIRGRRKKGSMLKVEPEPHPSFRMALSWIRAGLRDRTCMTLDLYMRHTANGTSCWFPKIRDGGRVANWNWTLRIAIVSNNDTEYRTLYIIGSNY